MVSFENIHNACRTKFGTDIEDTYSIQVQYDNAKFDLDKSALGTYNLWIRYTVLLGASNHVMMGGNDTYRTTGIAKAQLRAPIDAGDDTLLEVADFIKTAFQSTTYNGVTFRTPYVTPMGRDGEWWRIDVNCPFQSDNVVS